MPRVSDRKSGRETRNVMGAVCAIHPIDISAQVKCRAGCGYIFIGGPVLNTELQT